MFKAQDTDAAAAGFFSALTSRAPVKGLAHEFYRYPARFSPDFARAAIHLFSEPGDVVLDPFMGGGTSLVEARLASRLSVGSDINPLAAFIARVKTAPLSPSDIDLLTRWASRISKWFSVDRSLPAKRQMPNYFRRNISTLSSWRLRKLIEVALHRISLMRSTTNRDFARCVLLRTSQWAFDGRDSVPSPVDFRERFHADFNTMLASATEYAELVRRADAAVGSAPLRRTLCLQQSAVRLHMHPSLKSRRPPRLVLTSPPYPGIHILYNRWQINGRRESPVPYWIIGQPDSNGSSHYTFGDRRCHLATAYFTGIQNSFTSVAKLLDHDSLVVQLVAFSRPRSQLPRFLDAMNAAGFQEVYLPSADALRDAATKRPWRQVPNRKWYAEQWGLNGARKEVVLFHKLA